MPRLPLSTALVLLFGSIMTVAMTVMLATNVYIAGTNTRDLLVDRVNLTLRGLTSQVDGFLAPIADHLAVLRTKLTDGSLGDETGPVASAFVRGMMAATPQLAGIAIVDANGTITRFPRDNGAPIVEHVPKDEVAAALDAIARRDDVVWGDPLWSPMIEATIINARLALPAADGRQRMLVGAVSLQTMALQVRNMALQERNPVFVLHGRSNIIADSVELPDDVELDAAHPLPAITQSGDPVLRAFWSTAEPINVGAEMIDGHGQHVTAGGVGYIAYYRMIEGYTNKPWIVGTYLSALEASTELRRVPMLAAIGVGLIALALVMTLLIGRHLARPVQRLAGHARRIKDLDIARLDDLPRSRIREIDEAAGTFNAMAHALNGFEMYLSKRLVRQLLARHGTAAVASAEREVTVLFTDIVGFSREAAAMSAHETQAFLNAHFTCLDAVIAKHEGTIDKFIGDSVMAFWGAPDDQPDHARLACMAALEIRERLAREAPGLRLRIGIHSGMAVVGNIGSPDRVDFTLVGDTVNTAQRLEQLGKQVADPPQVVILVSGATARGAACDGIAPTPRSPVSLQGHTMPVEVFEL